MPNNSILVSDARSILEQLKQETAAELGIQDYEHADKASLPSRVNGSVGGYMVKKMVAYAQMQLANHNK